MDRKFKDKDTAVENFRKALNIYNSHPTVMLLYNRFLLAQIPTSPHGSDILGHIHKKIFQTLLLKLCVHLSVCLCFT